MPESFIRASDNDRAAVAAELIRAHTEGRLTLTEFDERTRAVHEARTYADLAALTADLPIDPVTPTAPPTATAPPTTVTPTTATPTTATPTTATPADPRPSRTVAKGLTTAWVAASTVNFLVWGVLSLVLGEVLYPWWLWVAVPWGALLLAGRLGRFGRSS
ncbi:DUF1707 domain-containing protein [Actinosynnema sp. NPDC059335]|uniref:DUF1707 SHOCT-like domain-containing protein n=1 Tax=Actinosynnema sp. NPDC059335 TaxID=3346804 RepID=UPI00366DA3AF